MHMNTRVAAVLGGTLATTAALAATASGASAAQEVPGSGGQPLLAFFGPLLGAVQRPMNVSVDVVTFIFERLASNHAEDLADDEI